VPPADVVSTGATLIRTTFPPDQIPGIVVAYMAGIKVALAIAVGGAGVGFLLALCNKWQRLGTKSAKDAAIAIA